MSHRDTASRPRLIRSPPLLCLTAFVLVDVWLFMQPILLESTWLLAAIAIPQAQCSIAALWSALSPSHRVLRITFTPIVLIASWFLLMRLLSWAVTDNASAGWALLLIIQCVSAVLLLKLYRLAVAFFDPKATSRVEYRFDLTSLLIWTTVIAAGFGVAQFARIRFGWSSEVATWSHFFATPVLAFSNALLAILWFWAFDRVRSLQRIVRIILAVGLGYALALTTYWLANWITNTQSIDWRGMRTMVASQSCVLAVASAMMLSKLRPVD